MGWEPLKKRRNEQGARRKEIGERDSAQRCCPREASVMFKVY
jgi:hypothetical protein